MKSIFAASILLIVLITGCATDQSELAHTTGPTDTCYVCKYNNDLACVCVKVKDTTPKTEYAGHTYYFCSDDCRKAFEKKPVKYLPKS